MADVKRTVKATLRTGRSVIGNWTFFADPAAVEIAGLVGFDFVIIDMEHCARDFAQVEHMVRAADAAGVAAIVRVPAVDESAILRALECGAQGIMVPKVESAEQARQVVSAARYPPDGSRGALTVSRAARYGVGIGSAAEYFTRANETVIVVALIETPEGAENIRAIVSAGVDVALVGRGDMSAAMGVPGQASDPRVLALADKVVAECNGVEGCWAGVAGKHSAAELEGWVRKGARVFTFGDDRSVLRQAMQDGLREWRAAADAATAR